MSQNAICKIDFVGARERWTQCNFSVVNKERCNNQMVLSAVILDYSVLVFKSYKWEQPYG